MKENIQRNAFQIVVFAAALLAACVLTGTANAQFSALEGKFTLPHETHWGQAELPPGEYTLSLITTGSPAMAVIHDAKAGKQVATVAFQTRGMSKSGGTALLVDTQGTQPVIYSLRVAELGAIFISDPALARKSLREEASKTQVVPVAMAKN